MLQDLRTRLYPQLQNVVKMSQLESDANSKLVARFGSLVLMAAACNE